MVKMEMNVATNFIIFGTMLLTSSSAVNPEESGDLMEGDILGVAPSLLHTTRSGILGDYYRWPYEIVPYEVNSEYPEDLRRILLQAMKEISQKTCIRFTLRYSQPDYIHIYSGKTCSSYVGRRGGSQLLSLHSGCWRIGTFIHELMHAIGFFHEQSRTDRDNYVTINSNNIQSGREGNFRKYGVTSVSNFGIVYDYDSVMHYSKTAFSINGRETITPTQSGAVIGQRIRMSSGDIAKINNMYCKN